MFWVCSVTRHSGSGSRIFHPARSAETSIHWDWESRSPYRILWLSIWLRAESRRFWDTGGFWYYRKVIELIVCSLPAIAAPQRPQMRPRLPQRSWTLPAAEPTQFVGDIACSILRPLIHIAFIRLFPVRRSFYFRPVPRPLSPPRIPDFRNKQLKKPPVGPRLWKSHSSPLELLVLLQILAKKSPKVRSTRKYYYAMLAYSLSGKKSQRLTYYRMFRICAPA